jgi:hypothetical protein
LFAAYRGYEFEKAGKSELIQKDLCGRIFERFTWNERLRFQEIDGELRGKKCSSNRYKNSNQRLHLNNTIKPHNSTSSIPQSTISAQKKEQDIVTPKIKASPPVHQSKPSE